MGQPAPWPWQASPRRPPPACDGDVEGAIAFGLATSREELEDLTAMLCSGLPPEADCRAVWERDGAARYVLSVDTPEVKYRQTFVSSSTGLAVRQDLFILPEHSRHRRFATRLLRNLVLAYDALGVTDVSVTASWDGAYTWARLGARAKFPDTQKKELVRRVREKAEEWGISPDLRIAIEEALLEASDAELMYRAASLIGEDGTRYGQELLVGHHWEGCWDLSDPELRSFLRETLK